MIKYPRIIAGFSFVALTFLLLNGCSRQSAAVAPSVDPTVTAACYNKPPVANNLLALDLYKQYQPNSDNIFFSPFSISSALAMTYEGAKGQTASEMLSVLHLETDPTARKNDYQAVFTEINKPDKKYQLSTSNNLWLEKDFPFLPSYLDIVTNFYSALLTNMDFINNPDGSRQTINDAVSQQTQGKITNLLPSGSINPATRLVLTNAIYFKATWMAKFDANSTFAADFRVAPEQTVQPQTMHMLKSGVVEDFPGNTKVLELPYENKDVSMFIFLPAEGGMADLETNLTAANFNTWITSRSTSNQFGGQVELSLPKFKFDTSYNMGGTLSTLGMPTAFNPGAADFSGMATLPPDARLYISKVLHKAFVAVDEDGTEAAAATAVVISYADSISSQPFNPPVPFHVDHPFIFMLYENNVKTILFMGRVNDPTAS